MKSKHLLLMLLLAFALPWAAMGQSVATYTFSTGQSQAKWITLSDEATTLVASEKDDSYSSLTNIGFTFPFGGGTYSQFWANSNGVFSFNSTPAGDRSIAFGNSYYGSYTSSQPKICGISSDMSTGNNGYVKYELTGTAPNRILVCEFYLNGSGWSTSTSATIKWQVQLYEADSKVALVYGDAPSSDPTDFQTGLSASSSDIVLVDPSSHTVTPTNTYSTTTYSVWPGAYRYYEFVAPNDPYIILAPASETVFTGFTTTLTATYGNITGTPTINYTSSNEGVAKVVGDGTTATVRGVAPGTATITATMNGTYTATCAITVEDPSYCTPAPTSVDGSGMHPVVFGSGTQTVNNTSYPTSAPYYGDYSSMIGAYEQGETATVDMSFYTYGYSGYNYGVVIWVDWNKDYEFSDSEIVYTGTSTTPSSSTSPGTLTATFDIPNSQAANDYRMRIGAADDYFDSFINGSSTAAHDPCYNGSYTCFHDYTLRVEAGNSCQKPTNLTETQVGTTTAVLNWEGENDSYVLQYRTAAHDNMNLWEQVGEDIIGTATLTQYTFDLSNYSGTGNIAIRHYNVSDMFRVAIDDIVVTNANGTEVVNEGFEEAFPSDWGTVDYDGDGFNWARVGFSDEGYQHGSYCMSSESWVSGYGALDPDNWLIITDVELGGTLTFYMRGVDASFPQENIGVFVTTASLETVFGTTPAGDWSADIPVATTSRKLTGLTANTPYEWRVKGICNGYSEPSNWATSSFTTIAEGFKTFVTEGNWDVAANWFPEGVPAITDEVSIEAPVTIPAGVVATAKRADLNGGSILIKDGGQLKQGAATLRVTMEKEITGYGTGNGNWYFISSPFSGRTLYHESGTWSRVDNMLTGEYDLYAFDATDEDGKEWINYEANPTHISFESENGNAGLLYGEGYLYANQDGTTLQFIGTTGKSINYSETLDYTFDGESTDEWNGWALVGNYFSCNAYINYVDANNNVLNADFYVMNGNGNGYTLSQSGVGLAPCTGAFINVAATGKIQYSTEVPTGTTIYNRALNMSVSNGRGIVDMARVRFGQGYNLKHMSFRNNSKLFIPQDNDYAVVYTEENAGEMPVSFKAEENGTYTLGFNTENVEFNYLHLIDNMTGADVNLLETPSYSFEAKTTDYASRFKLVFSANSTVSEESFAFMSDGNLIVNNEGNATLQVIDVNGRILRSESINGSASIDVNAAPGVYMIRLVNGENVRTQKIVVK